MINIRSQIKEIELKMDQVRQAFSMCFPSVFQVQKININETGPGTPSVFHVGASVSALVPEIKWPGQHRDQVSHCHIRPSPRFETGAHGDEDNFDGPGGEMNTKTSGDVVCSDMSYVKMDESF